MYISRIDNLISADTLVRINELLSKGRFVNGHVSGGHDGNKKNLELPIDDENYLEALQLVETEVRQHREFNLTAYPRYMSRPILSRYDEGMYYKTHVDFPVLNFLSVQMRRAKGLAPIGQNYIRSDLSMTVFLSPDETYDGGELTLDGTIEKIKVKLPAGSGVLYPTGTPHAVAEVTRGSRVAAVFWIQSMFPVESHRRVLADARELLERVEGSSPPGSREVHLAEQVYFNSFRMFAQV
jgi:PKHD-type hydroxylase